MDASKPIKASEYVKTPDVVHEFSRPYIMLVDSSVTGSFVSMIEAINLLAERGWETVSISKDNGTTMHALVRRIDKAKN